MIGNNQQRAAGWNVIKAAGVDAIVDLQRVQRVADKRRRGQYLGAHAVVLFEGVKTGRRVQQRSEEYTSELQSLMRISYAVFCLKNKKNSTINTHMKQRNNDPKA